ncbi:glycoside hydrolase family 16 protein [Amanita thiersii Skay4041]|uniref:Glycoside hydrolase family 16 protein n=1 Tax=Amanita thiersii Skay4041 TaxID=703135 RepID=A0A2A9NYN4_9AGAR|nr:glycoside hydrolase family 16 protein [Amanita thiersii Skay4041]
MKLTPSLLLSLLLISDFAEASIFGRSLHKAHTRAVAHTHNLARDLRVAFSGILLSRADGPQKQQVLYCRASGRGGNTNNTDGGSGGTNHTAHSTVSGSTSSTGTKTSSGSSATPTAPVSSPWKLVETHKGSSFFDGWSFFVGGDPTHGIVEYVDQNGGWANNLLQINDAGNAIMRVETTPKVQNTRKSIRITSQSSWNGGLIIMDSVHMPTGCGTWPAFWTNGPTWPTTGEIDIVEGVHDYTNNQATIHTDPGCTIASSNSNTLSISGNVIGGTDCAALTTGNQGCGIRASSSNSFGKAFNDNGGGVYAMKWDTTGVAIYFFSRGSVPADILAGVPNPDGWGTAQARWPATSCDPFKYFINHSAIFDTTLCGDWAGAVWGVSGIPGQEQSCAARTGFATCEEFVRSNGVAFNEAYWEVKSVQIYQLR